MLLKLNTVAFCYGNCKWLIHLQCTMDLEFLRFYLMVGQSWHARAFFSVFLFNSLLYVFLYTHVSDSFLLLCTPALAYVLLVFTWWLLAWCWGVAFFSVILVQLQCKAGFVMLSLGKGAYSEESCPSSCGSQFVFCVFIRSFVYSLRLGPSS